MSLDVKRQLSCLTECSVCKETYNDPRMLPCVHSFCVICIQGFCDNKLPGDHVPCPICRKIFTVPDNGVDGLPKNFFIEQLKDVTLTSNRHCEGCYDGGTDPALQKQAAFYCVECQQKLCETCVNVHKRLRTTREHRLAEIGQDENIRFAHRDLKIIYCRKHPARAVEMYCLNCKDAICLMCFVELHKSHECSDVNKFVDEFKIQMTNDIKNMEQTVKKVLDVVKEQQERKENFSKHVDEIELKICKRAEQLKKAIDSEKQKLIQELASRKKDRIKQMQLVIVEVERRVSFVESLIKYTEELRDKGSASDVAQQARNLHDRADELVNLDDVHRQINDLGSMQFLFNAVKLSTEATGCLIGHVDWQHFKGNSFDLEMLFLLFLYPFFEDSKLLNIHDIKVTSLICC
jgi:hypothetical protein